MKIISFLLLFCMVVMLTACPKGLYSTRPSTKLGQDKLVNMVNTFLANRQQAYYCAINGVDPTFSISTEAKDFGITYQCAASASVTTAKPNLNLAKRIRNEVLENGITAVDGTYDDFINNLNNGRATTNFVADVIDLGVGAAVGITKGERALHILGVALTAFRGGRKSIDLNFYREQTVPILVNKMDDNRAKIYSEIIIQKGRDVDAYPMEEAIRDIVRYYNAGTLIRAFGELAKDTAATAKVSEDKILIQKDLNFDKPISTKTLDQGKANFKFITEELRGKLLVAREKTDKKAIKNIVSVYEQIYFLILNDPIMAPVVTESITSGFLKTRVPDDAKEVCKTGVDANGDRDFTDKVKAKEKLICEDDYQTFLQKINFFVTNDEKFSKEGEEFQNILSKFKETKK